MLGWCFALRVRLPEPSALPRRWGNQLYLLSGLLTRRSVFIDRSRITARAQTNPVYEDIRSAYRYHNRGGLRTGKRARPVIIPAAGPRDLCGALDTLLPDYPTCPAEVHRPLGRWSRYTLLPLLITLGSLVPFITEGVEDTCRRLVHHGRMVAYHSAYRIPACRLGCKPRSSDNTVFKGLALYEIHRRAGGDCARYRGAMAALRRTLRSSSSVWRERRKHRVHALPVEQTRRLVELLVS